MEIVTGHALLISLLETMVIRYLQAVLLILLIAVMFGCGHFFACRQNRHTQRSTTDES